MTVTIRVGDCRDVLREMEPESVQMACTSPPFWRLRSYLPEGHPDKPNELGGESTPEEYVSNLVEVFRLVHRVLRPNGCVFLNLGDSYNGSGGAGGDYNAGGLRDGQPRYPGRNVASLKPKDLVGIPWAVAFALRADGWWLRSDIIWAKPNPMPESVTDRPTKAHEYLFLLTKSARYFYDADAIREGNADPNRTSFSDSKRQMSEDMVVASGDSHRGFGTTGKSLDDYAGAGRNKRTVWTIPTHSFPGAHFATFPPALVEPCIKAGTKEGDTVLDPFAGACTVGLEADRLGRDAELIELNPAYVAMGRKRIQDASPMFAEVEVI